MPIGSSGKPPQLRFSCSKWYDENEDSGGNSIGYGPTSGNTILRARKTNDIAKPRERLIDAAYDLFSKNGVNQIGIDTILAKSGCAKASLYSNFDNKVELAIAFLDRREAVWTRVGWNPRFGAVPQARKQDCWQFSTCSTAGFAKSRLRAALLSMCCWSQKRGARSAKRLRSILPKSVPLSAVLRPGKPSRARKVFPGVAHVDEGVDRFSG